MASSPTTESEVSVTVPDVMSSAPPLADFPAFPAFPAVAAMPLPPLPPGDVPVPGVPLVPGTAAAPAAPLAPFAPLADPPDNVRSLIESVPPETLKSWLLSPPERSTDAPVLSMVSLIEAGMLSGFVRVMVHALEMSKVIVPLDPAAEMNCEDEHVVRVTVVAPAAVVARARPVATSTATASVRSAPR
jgi:hypothetical protein